MIKTYVLPLCAVEVAGVLVAPSNFLTTPLDVLGRLSSA